MQITSRRRPVKLGDYLLSMHFYAKDTQADGSKAHVKQGGPFKRPLHEACKDSHEP